MNREEAIALLKSGPGAVAHWNRWMRNGKVTDLIRLDLSGANLSDIDLDRVNLSQIKLRRTDLRGASMQAADLTRSDLAEANLSGALLDGAILEQANLTSADLSRSGLFHTNFSEACLSDANLTGSYMSEARFIETQLKNADFSNGCMERTVFSHVDLSQSLGLETVHHNGPSVISIDTLYKSGGKIPRAFLCGCGVPDELIEYVPSLLGACQAIEFYSCFISYSHQNEAFCKRLHSRMRDEHLRVWFAREDMKGGEKLHEQIDSAIRVHDKLLLVLSQESMTSNWVKTEIRRARQREEKEGTRVLFPIRLVPFESIQEWNLFDADVGDDSAAEIREYYIPDFSNWKDHDAFEAAFQRLLSDLKAATDGEGR